MKSLKERYEMKKLRKEIQCDLQEKEKIEPKINRYTILDFGNFGAIGTAKVLENEMNETTKIIIEIITNLMMTLQSKCPVYESLNHCRTELIIALENNTLTKDDIEIINDFVQNHLATIEYHVSWCQERIYLVDDDNIMTNYVAEIMDDELTLLVQYILEFNRLLNSLFFVKRYNSDYED